MSNKYYSSQFKNEVVTAYKNQDFKVKELLERYQIPDVTLYNWVEIFESDGSNGFEDSRTRKAYTKELKEAAVRDYLSGKHSQYEIVRKYGIS
ncbi:transposase, partial [Desertibacillus haloalkaliphilus]|uniref:transposase n=1 Tax=Desertibacillus haloalkaliphilus TaxID=1328930 RepID=UPI001C280A4F